MEGITQAELTEAVQALTSMISKLEKARVGLSPTAKSQITLIDRRIKALSIALTLITQELDAG